MTILLIAVLCNYLLNCNLTLTAIGKKDDGIENMCMLGGLSAGVPTHAKRVIHLTIYWPTA